MPKCWSTDHCQTKVKTDQPKTKGGKNGQGSDFFFKGKMFHLKSCPFFRD